MPDAGGVDTSSYAGYGGTNQLLAAATNTPQVANAWQQNALQKQALSSQQLELAKQKLSAFNGVVSSIMADPSAGNFDSRLNDAVQAGVITPQMRAQAAAETAGMTDQQRQQYAFQHSQQTASYQQQLEAAYGAPSQVNTGNALTSVLTKQGPGAGVYSGGGNPLPMQQTPGDLARPVTVKDRHGIDSTMTQGQFQTSVGQPPGQSPYGAVAAGKARVVGGKIVYDGAASAAGAPQASNPQGQAVGANGQPNTAAALPGIQGPAPGQVEAANAAGQQSGQQLAIDRATASNYQQTINPLAQAIPKLEALGATGTGPGTEQLNQVKSFLQSAGLPGLDASKIQNFDEAKKYFTDFVNKNGNTGTNDKLAAAFAGSPSVGISNAAAIDVAKSALSLSRMQQAKVLSFENTGLPESAYSKWAAQWNTSQDPRAYGYDMMSAPAQQKLVSGLSGAERTKFIASLRAAHDSGLLRPAGGQ